MKDRLLGFLSAENISATQFADEIGVQRSSVSHILAGRNNPSFDFIQKTLSRYSHLNAEWLMLGKGGMFKHSESPRKNLFTEAVLPKAVSESSQDPLPDNFSSFSEGSSPLQYPDSQKLEAEGVLEQVLRTPGKDIPIERIVVFYANRTCREYRMS